MLFDPEIHVYMTRHMAENMTNYFNQSGAECSNYRIGEAELCLLLVAGILWGIYKIGSSALRNIEQRRLNKGLEKKFKL